MNCTDWPTIGAVGVKLKAATGASEDGVPDGVAVGVGVGVAELHFPALPEL